MAAGPAELWLDAELSDMDVVLAVAAERADDTNNRDTNSSAPVRQLSKLPGHTLLLSRSSYLKAQVMRWQRKRPLQQPFQQQPQPKQPKSTTRSQKQHQQPDQAAQDTTPPDNDRPQVVLTLQDAAQEPAARAVLASLYDKPLPELLSGLSQEEQLAAAVLADMWDVPAFSAAAAAALAKAAESPTGLEDAVSQQLVGMQEVPACLLPVLAAMLLTTYGDLEAVWRDSMLQKQLLAFPLPALAALLSSSKLKVGSEDTVLYTAQQYVDSIQDEQQQQTARKQLAPLIRCPHLSLCWLAASVNPSGGALLLHRLSEHVWKLLMCRLADQKAKLEAARVPKLFPGAPASWALPPRPSVVVAAVELRWSLPVSKLRAAAQQAAITGERVLLRSPQHSPPLYGMTFRPECHLVPSSGGTATCSVFVSPAYSSIPMCCWSAVFHVRAGLFKSTTSPVASTGHDWGFRDFWDVGPMAGGWDDAKTAAAGVPRQGNLDISLHVTRVGHADGR